MAWRASKPMFGAEYLVNRRNGPGRQGINRRHNLRVGIPAPKQLDSSILSKSAVETLGALDGESASANIGPDGTIETVTIKPGLAAAVEALETLKSNAHDGTPLGAVVALLAKNKDLDIGAA